MMTAEKAMQAPTRNFSVLAYANGFTQWHYKVPAGDFPRLITPEYWRDFGDMLSAGDLVQATSSEGAGTMAVLGRPGAFRLAWIHPPVLTSSVAAQS